MGFVRFVRRMTYRMADPRRLKDCIVFINFETPSGHSLAARRVRVMGNPKSILWRFGERVDFLETFLDSVNEKIREKGKILLNELRETGWIENKQSSYDATPLCGFSWSLEERNITWDPVSFEEWDKLVDDEGQRSATELQTPT